eukprot:scaffold2711_cov127-Skeletonema_menzelii.AAC.6
MVTFISVTTHSSIARRWHYRNIAVISIPASPHRYHDVTTTPDRGGRPSCIRLHPHYSDVTPVLPNNGHDSIATTGGNRHSFTAPLFGVTK